MSVCPNCAAQNSKTAKYCTNCGTLIQGINAPEIPNQNGNQATFQPSIQPLNPVSKDVVKNVSSFTSSAGIWGSVLFFVGFVTNWVSIPASKGIIKLSGYKLLTISQETILGLLGGDTDSGSVSLDDHYRIITPAQEYAAIAPYVTIGRVVLILILLSVLITFLYSLGKKINSSLVFVCKIFPFIVLLAVIIFLFLKLNGHDRTFDEDSVDGNSLNAIGLGFYLTFISSIVLLFQKPKRA